MRIIILNQFFYPDHSATSQLMTELAESLVERGVSVTAVAGRGRYNGGDRLPRREEHKGIRIERAWATGFGKRTVAGRLLDYLSFYVGAWWKLLSLPRHDVVMALTTPPLIGLVALLAGRLKGSRVLILVQDVYPDIAVKLGALREDGVAARALDWINSSVSKRSDGIIVLGEAMREQVAAKVGENAAARIAVIHNWADEAVIRPLEDANNPFAAEHALDGSFVVLFSGNLGLVNDFSTVLEAARLLRHRSDIIFLFIGQGARESEIREVSNSQRLNNVRLLPYQSRESLRYSLAAGHALLVTLANGLAGLSEPSKAYAIMAAGRPILFVGDPRCDIARMIVEHDCGSVIASGAASELAQVIEQWSQDRSKLEALGSRARGLFEARFSRSRAVDAYLDAFAKCISLKASPSEIPAAGDAAIEDTA